MTLKIVKGQPWERKLIRLMVVGTPSVPAGEYERLDDCKASLAATTLMSRLMILDSCSIVGLLVLHRSASNYDEFLA